MSSSLLSSDLRMKVSASSLAINTSALTHTGNGWMTCNSCCILKSLCKRPIQNVRGTILCKLFDFAGIQFPQLFLLFIYSVQMNLQILLMSTGSALKPVSWSKMSMNTTSDWPVLDSDQMHWQEKKSIYGSNTLTCYENKCCDRDYR